MIKIKAPHKYWKLSHIEKIKICNGCGAKGSIFTLILQAILYIFTRLFRLACNIHDYSYYVGTTYEDKILADINFKRNLIAIAESCHPLIIPFIRIVAMAFYKSVIHFGVEAFYEDKELFNLIEKEVII